MRAPGPREAIVQPDRVPTAPMAAWMRDVTMASEVQAAEQTATAAAHAATAALLAALVAKLVEDEVLPEGWPDA